MSEKAQVKATKSENKKGFSASEKARDRAAKLEKKLFNTREGFGYLLHMFVVT